MAKPWTPDNYRKAVAMWAEDIPSDAIAAHFGVSRSAVAFFSRSKRRCRSWRRKRARWPTNWGLK